MYQLYIRLRALAVYVFHRKPKLTPVEVENARTKERRAVPRYESTLQTTSITTALERIKEVHLKPTDPVLNSVQGYALNRRYSDRAGGIGSLGRGRTASQTPSTVDDSPSLVEGYLIATVIDSAIQAASTTNRYDNSSNDCSPSSSDSDSGSTDCSSD